MAMASAREWEERDEPLETWYRMTTARGGTLDYQMIGSRLNGGRRLLVVDLDAEAESRVLDAIAVLTGRPVG